jgi:hypothetical protein
MKPRTVALYGNNLAMSAVAASLQQKSYIRVHQIEELLPDILEKLNAAPPDVILFDLSLDQPDFAIALLRKHPMVVLIGVDLTSNRMLVLSGEQSRLLTTDDLVKVVERGAS